MSVAARTIGFLSLAGAIWALLVGNAHFEVLLLSGSFLLGSLTIAGGRHRKTASSATLEIAARLAALGAEHDGLTARMKAVEAGVKRDVEKRAQEMIDDAAAVTSARAVVAVMPGGRDNVVRLFRDGRHGKPGSPDR